MTPEKLISEIQNYCRANANEENARKTNRYFKEPQLAYGLNTSQLTDKVKDLLKDQEINLSTVVKATDILIQSPQYEEPAIGLLLINGFGKQYTRDTFNNIASWYTLGIHNWAHADILGMYILPQFMLRKIITLSDFKSWISSSYKFQRRCVPVTLIKVLKNDKAADFKPYFSFIEPLMEDKEREVHQGTGWFLREAWKIQPGPTEEFLLKWKDRSARLIIQYATEKMNKEYKERFRKIKN
jgi:3-methyladenine DNA glycosylase AlkD